jgi:hypothetical protein
MNLPGIDPNIIINLQKDTIQDDSIGRPSYMLCFLQEPSLIETPTSYAIQRRQALLLDDKIYKTIERYHGWIQYTSDKIDGIPKVVPGDYFGHGGVERTLTLLREYLPLSQQWVGMRKDVATFIGNCPQCQFMESSKLKIKPKSKCEPFNNYVSKPWELIALDSMGPFPEDENSPNFRRHYLKNVRRIRI